MPWQARGRCVLSTVSKAAGEAEELGEEGAMLAARERLDGVGAGTWISRTSHTTL